MGRRKNNGVSPNCGLPPAAQRSRQPPQIKHAPIATVKTIMFCDSAKADALWKMGYPDGDDRKGYVLHAVTNPGFGFDLIKVTRHPESRELKTEVVQSFNLPSEHFETSIYLYGESRTIVFIQQPRKHRNKAPYCRWAITIGAVHMQYSKDFWLWMCGQLKQLDYSSLKYVNLERPHIQSDDTRMKLRSGKLLGERVNGGKAVRYSIPGVSHQWEFTGFIAQESFQTSLGRVYDQNNDPIDFSGGRTRREESRAQQLDYKKKKALRQQKEATESNEREETRRQKRSEKRARNNRNKRKKTLEQRDPDADYEPSSPLVPK